MLIPSVEWLPSSPPTRTQASQFCQQHPSNLVQNHLWHRTVWEEGSRTDLSVKMVNKTLINNSPDQVKQNNNKTKMYFYGHETIITNLTL